MSTHYTGTDTERLALDAYIKLSRSAEVVSQNINDHLREYDLTLSQFGVIEALYHLGSLQTGELGAKILKSSGNMTLVIDNLVKRGLVKRRRREDDRRVIEVSLTESGQTLITKIWPTHLQGVVSTFDTLTAEEQETLAQLCRKLGLAQME